MGHHWRGPSTKQLKIVTPIETPEECQTLCNEDHMCNWFNWRNNKHPKGCFLQTARGENKATDKGRDEGATGPKRCEGEQQT